MRNRKPCVRARRRLFGWKVRLLTALAPKVVRQGSTGDRVALENEAIGHLTVRLAPVRVKQAGNDVPSRQ